MFLLNTHTHTTVLRPFIRVYLGEPVPEERSIHSHPSCSSTHTPLVLLLLLNTEIQFIIDPAKCDIGEILYDECSLLNVVLGCVLKWQKMKEVVDYKHDTHMH